MNQVLNENKNKKAKKKVEEERNKITLYLPYEKIISEKISKISPKYNVTARHTKNESLKNLVKNNIKEEDNDILEEKGVVYEVPCKSCNKKYIGEIGRKLKVRLNEHKTDGENESKKNVSGLSTHMKENKRPVALRFTLNLL